MDDKKRTEVAGLLKAKGATMPCQRCGSQKFDIIGPTGVDSAERWPRAAGDACRARGAGGVH